MSTILETVVQFFATLLFLVVTPYGWLVIGGMFGALVGVYLAIMFLGVYFLCWRILRMTMSGLWSRRLARCVLRLQIVLFAVATAAHLGPGLYDQGWKASMIAIAILTSLLLPPLVQEVLIRMLTIGSNHNGASEMSNPVVPTQWQRITNTLNSVALEIRTIVVTIKRDGGSTPRRVFRAIGISFVFCAIAVLPMMAALEVAAGTGNHDSEMSVYCFWGLIGVSMVFAVVFDLVTMTKHRKRRFPTTT